MTQIDLLNNEIAELIRVRDEMEVKLQTTNSTPEQNAIQNNIDGLNKTIGEKQAQLAEQEKIEEKADAAVPFAIAGVSIDKLPPEVIDLIKVVIKVDRRQHFAEHAVELEQQEAEFSASLKAIEAEVAEIRAAKDELQNEVADANRQNEDLQRVKSLLQDKLYELTLENEDLTSKLKNAVAQIEEKEVEIERLNSLVDDYQKAKVFGERQAQSVIDVTANEAEEINEAINKLNKFLSVEDWGSVLKVTKPDGNFELVKRDEFNSNWAPEVPAYQGGSESNESFRDEDTQTDVADGGLSYPEAPSLNLQFPEGEETGTAGMAGDSTQEEVVGETVTRAEFEEVKRRLKAVERKLEPSPHHPSDNYGHDCGNEQNAEVGAA